MDRFIALIKALGAHYDKEPYFEGLMFQEGVYHILAAGSDYTHPDMLAQLKDEQAVRDALRTLPSRCRQLVEMLFFETPARPYQQVARRLGLAVGSIGFIRGRCLSRLRRELERLGVR